MIGQTISHYKILDKLGEGGMGEVYVAEQERHMRRKVALKVIKLGMDSKEVIARFESERQALALMDHPNIAHVFEAGTTETGRPFFVMEYVPGVPITDYCDEHRLSTRERLELFIPVCRAIHHAHQKGIIHRDLKPSNIMVMIRDGKPVPKIIDFGLAKALHQPLTEKTVYTKRGALLGTPAYMSPEQTDLAGLNIDTTTDVYSLGVVLYEMLVGTVPLDSRQLLEDGIESMHRMIREKTPSRPSVRISEMGEKANSIAVLRGTIPVMLEGQLRGDIDWIIMKAIEKDRTRRYQSASEFAEDVGRYLRNDLVNARPPSPGYRLKKFAARNKVGVTAGILVISAILIGFAAASIGFVRARQAEEHARQEAATAERVSEFLTGLFEVSDPGESRGNEISAREILDEGARKIREELAGEPLLKARLMDTMGNVYQSLGLYEEARPLLEEALAIRRGAMGDVHPAVAVSMNNLANILEETADYEAARPLYEQALAIWVGTSDPDSLNVALALDNLANLFKSVGEYEEARPFYERSLAIREKTLGPDDLDVSRSLNNLANLLSVTGDYEGARPLYERAISTKETKLGHDHPDLAMNLNNLANVLYFTGDYTAAEEMYRKALAIQEKVLGSDHPMVAVTINNIGELLMETGDHDEAGPLFERARRDWEKKLGPDHPYVAYSLHNLAKLASIRGDYERADRNFRDAQQIWEKKVGPDHPDMAENLEHHAGLLHKMGRHQEAANLEDRVKAIRAGSN